MSRYSIYVLSPDRRFVDGTEVLDEATSKAQEIALTWKNDSRGQKVERVEVWDNQKQAPIYSAQREYGGNLIEAWSEGC